MLQQKIGFIGGGNMAQAIIGGLISQGLNPQHIYVSDPNVDIREKLQQKGINVTQDNAQLVSQTEVIILAIKPQVASEVLSALKGKIHSQMVISIMAGVEIETISQLLGNHQRIIRVMPNTPALVQQGASGAFALSLTEQDQQIATQILQATGLVVWVKQESDIDVVTAVSGSGPAYFFYMFEQMIQAGVDLGLTPETARQLTLQTALGSAQMAIQSTESPAQLRKNVTSPNGTTQAAIETFDKLNVAQGIYQGVCAAQKRSHELAQQLKS